MIKLYDKGRWNKNNEVHTREIIFLGDFRKNGWQERIGDFCFDHHIDVNCDYSKKVFRRLLPRLYSWFIVRLMIWTSTEDL